MDSALADVAFLANSANRVAVLESLGDGPHSRHVLAEKTDVSRVTLGRILDELDDRSWIAQRGQQCEITPLGAWAIKEFDALTETMEAERELRRVFQWMPAEGYGFHISRLAEAEITLVSRADASAPISRLVQQFEVGGRIVAFSFAITSQFLRACWRHVVDGSVTWEWVFTADVLDVLRTDPEMARYSREMLDTGRADYYLYDGDIPHVVIISDDAVNLRLADEDGAATALLQSDDGDVRSWATATFEEYRRDGTPVGPEAFAP